MFESENFRQIIQAPKGRKIVRVEVSDNREELVIFSELQNKVFTQTELDTLFPVIKASELSLTDAFLQHIPKTEAQKDLKSKIEAVIRKGIPDFRHPIIDPSVDEDGNIFFQKGVKPGTNHSMKWWEINAKQFLPTKNSRIGEESQYYAFVASLLKWKTECDDFDKNVKFYLKYFNKETKYTEEQVKSIFIQESWEDICDNSKSIGEYCDTRGGENWTKHPLETKKTGSMPYGIWCDLANTVKVVRGDITGKLIFMGGCAYFNGSSAPVSKNSTNYAGENYCKSTGWMVFDV